MVGCSFDRKPSSILVQAVGPTRVGFSLGIEHRVRYSSRHYRTGRARGISANVRDCCHTCNYLLIKELWPKFKVHNQHFLASVIPGLGSPASEGIPRWAMIVPSINARIQLRVRPPRLPQLRSANGCRRAVAQDEVTSLVYGVLREAQIRRGSGLDRKRLVEARSSEWTRYVNGR